MTFFSEFRSKCYQTSPDKPARQQGACETLQTSFIRPVISLAKGFAVLFMFCFLLCSAASFPSLMLNFGLCTAKPYL